METRKKQKEVIREFLNEFKVNHKKIECRAILTEDEGVTHKVHSAKCSGLVEEVCDLLEKYI